MSTLAEQIAEIEAALDYRANRSNIAILADALVSLRSLEAQSDEVRRLKELLGMLYDKWENGDPCYLNGDIDCDSLGNAFQLSDAEEKSILDAIGSQP